ncbi:MAG: DUF3641 domain-containing protein, partial [Bdellovibrionales bacterium]|nr:DUF3641 domain-containing protein [Bdellovibrionales bacterium]
VGAFLPGSQVELEEKFRKELRHRFGIEFTSLYVLTNMPINRFVAQLRQLNQLDSYMEKLVGAFNPQAAQNVMCRNLISVSHDGLMFDCDFNQMLNMPILRTDGQPMNIADFDNVRLLERSIRFGSHCFGCTAGAGSSCGGQVADVS